LVKWAARAKVNFRIKEVVAEDTEEEEEAEVEEAAEAVEIEVEAEVEAMEAAEVDSNKMVKVDQEVHAVLLTRQMDAQNKVALLIIQTNKMFNLKIISKRTNPFNNRISSLFQVGQTQSNSSSETKASKLEEEESANLEWAAKIETRHANFSTLILHKFQMVDLGIKILVTKIMGQSLIARIGLVHHSVTE